MKRLPFFLASVFISLIAFSQPAKHVILISVDGLRPDFYLDSQWHTPTMHQLMKEGAYAKGVTSVFPSMTYPSHTTMVTGVQPAEHGVFFNAMFEPAGPTGKIYWHDSAIHVPTLWDAAKEKGLITAALFWPVSAGAPVQYNIPDIGSLGEKVRAQYSLPAGIIDTLKSEVFGDTAKIDYGTNTNVARIAAYVIGKAQPNFMAVHFFAADHAEHLEGRNGAMVHEAVSDADSGVAIILQAVQKAGIGENTSSIVTGDHGFVDTKRKLSPNVWLHNNGLLNNMKTGDWKAQFFSVGGSSFLYVKNNDATVMQQVTQILDKLPAEKKQHFAIVDRKRLDSVGGNTDVVLALTGLGGTVFDNDFSGNDIKEGKGGAHGYFPDFSDIQTGFIAAGAGINNAGVIEEMNERDICSVVAQLLALPMPSAKGTVPDRLLQP